MKKDGRDDKAMSGLLISLINNLSMGQIVLSHPP